MSTCDHICRECGQVMNCQHCKPHQLPIDRHRIAELEDVLIGAEVVIRMLAPTGQETTLATIGRALRRNQ